MQLKMKPNSVIIANLGLNKSGKVHKWFTDTCALHMDKYTPYRHGDLAKSVVVNGVVNKENVTEDTIIYRGDYACYVYYGMRQDGTHVIKNWTKDVHKDAGPYWDQRMWSAEKYKVIREVQNHFDKRGNK